MMWGVYLQHCQSFPLLKFGIPIPPQEYSIVFDAIPAGFLKILLGFIEFYKQLTFKISY